MSYILNTLIFYMFACINLFYGALFDMMFKFHKLIVFSELINLKIFNLKLEHGHYRLEELDWSFFGCGSFYRGNSLPGRLFHKMPEM